MMESPEWLKGCPIAWEKVKLNEITEQTYAMLLRWLPFGDQQYQDWPGRPRCGHFFDGAHWYGTETARTAFVYAFLAKVGDYDASVTGIPRDVVKERAIRGIRYLGFTHDAGPEDCVRDKSTNPLCSGTKWGGRHDSYFMATQAALGIVDLALAAWILWEELDDETRQLVGNLMEEYADRWSAHHPLNGVYNDTQCEENGWTSTGITAAMRLFPQHPRREEWRLAADRWANGTIGTYRDRIEREPKATITFHPDYTTENHGMVHPDYMASGLLFHGINSLFAMLQGESSPESALRGNEVLYESTIKPWVLSDGQMAAVQGQDRWYNQQTAAMKVHAFIHVAHGDREAGALARRTLNVVEGIQRSNANGCLIEENGEELFYNKAYFQSAKLIEYGAASGLAHMYLFYAFGNAAIDQLPEADEVLRRQRGVYHYPYGAVVIHRTERSFASFSWRNRSMALTLPEQGLWHITPLYGSYTGIVTIVDGETGERIRDDHAHDVARDGVTRYTDGFGAIATLWRGRRALRQDVAFVSLPNGLTVYMEQFAKLKPCVVEELATGLIGIRNENYSGLAEVAPGTRTLHLPDQSETFRGFYGVEPDSSIVREAPEYVNVDGFIGYVLRGSKRLKYINRHEYPKWNGVEDQLILNFRENEMFDGVRRSPAFALLSAPNASMEETRAISESTTQWTVDVDHVVLLETDGYLTYANFIESELSVTGERALNEDVVSIPIYPGYTCVEDGAMRWSGQVAGFSSGFLRRALVIETSGNHSQTGESGLSLEVSCNAGQLILINRSDDTVLTLCWGDTIRQVEAKRGIAVSCRKS